MEGNHEYYITHRYRIFSFYRHIYGVIEKLDTYRDWYCDFYTCSNLIIMSMGEYTPQKTEPLIVGSNQNFVDPLLQAIVLTAIVIGFAITAFLLVLVYRTFKVTKEDEIDVLTGGEEDE